MDAVVPLLVVGCGYVGERLARTEQARRPVLALVRSALRALELRTAGVRTLCMDLDEEGSALQPPLAAAAHGAAVVYLAPPPAHGTEDARLQRFLARLDGAMPTVLVYASTTGVYGHTAGATVDEHSPLAPGSDAARRRVAAERAASTWAADLGVRCAVLRLAGIYGPHRLPLERLRRGEPVLRPEDAGPGNRVHVDDLVAAIVAAVDRADATGTFNVCDGDACSTTEYFRDVAEAAGLPLPPFVSRAEAAASISPGMLAYLVESRRVDNRRLREELGVQLRYPTSREGVRASLAEMRPA